MTTFADPEPIMRAELTEAAALLREKDAASIGKAIGLLQETVFAFSMKVCGHREDAEDTMQEVLMRSLPHLGKIDDARALSVWLYTVAKNRCFRMRRKGAHAPRQTLSLDELMPGEADLERLLRDGGTGPEEQLLEGEQGKLVQKAVLTLPAQYRIVLVLHDMEDLDTEQVARVLGLQPGTVRVRLHRARLGVRKAMAQLLEGLPEPAAAARKKHGSGRKSDVQKKPVECREIFAGLSEVLDNRLPRPKCDQMRKHIETCPACVVFIRDLQTAIDRCRNLTVPCDSDMAPRLRSLLVTEYLRLIRKPVG